ncbi:hypothetical protein K492DRAFT_121582, partial [Lichtheimia hyalospora FSU 10163]
FNKYADPDTPDTISPEGMQRFFEDLGLSVEDVLVIAFAWKMNLQTMGKFNECVASALWSMLLGSKFPIVNDFLTFLQEKCPVRVVNRDQWQSFLEFAATVSPDLSDYDETSAWPVLFDEYVEWKREQA